MRDKVVARSGRRRLAIAVSGALCAGFVLSASSMGASARPSVVLGQVAPGGVPVASTVGAGTSSNPSVSGDGRYVVYEGPIGTEDSMRTTVYLTDRQADTTVELTTVPEGRRPGNSLNPVISGDGCDVVVVTEMALDVFRDDDTSDRWDVYRLRLERCGASGGWELVSTRNDGSSLARDDVSTIDPPAVSRSGTLIAYTHPADQLIEVDDVTTVSVVDLERPLSDPARSVAVAGMPLSAPDTQFVHAGIDQPAISGDGRFVAYRSDAASTEAVPGWGTGAVPGGPAVRQVYAWDRNELDPFEAVRLMSVRVDGQPALVDASDPVVSRDGSVIAFTSADVGLVPAVFPPCGGGCPTQVFRVDRDTDANGLYDEAGRTEITMVSSVSGDGTVVAGTAPSSQASLSADGQLIAFITKASNLQIVEASGGGEAADGDLLVADAVLDTLRRVTVTGDGIRPAVAAHARPHLSDSGRITVFDTLAAPQLAAGTSGRQVVTVASEPVLSLAEADLGTTMVGLTSDEWYVAVINTGPTTFTPTDVRVSDRRFSVNQEGSTCALGAPVPPGGDCTVRLTFTPSGPGPVVGTLTVAEEGFGAVSVSAAVRGAGGEPALRANPAGADLGTVVVGQRSAELKFDVENISLLPTSIASIGLTGANANQFAVTSDSCLNRALNPRATCSVGVTFIPTAPGRQTALVKIFTPTGQYSTMVAAGDAVYTPQLRLGASQAKAGDELLVGGEGYPPNSSLSILFGDDAGDPLIATTSADGTFLHWFPINVTESGGERIVIAQTSDGTAASAPVEIIEAPRDAVAVPGFGYGF